MPTGPQVSERQPNIVFIHAESMDGRKMGCMGYPAMRHATPNLDGLAERGVLFTNAYTNCPVCNPSRASMWTGKYPHHYRCWNNHEGLHAGVPTFQTTFDRAGYRTAAIGPLDYAWGMHSIRDRIGSWTRSANIRRQISRTPLPRVVEDGNPWSRDWEWTHQAINWMRDASRAEQPFLLYLTTGLVHPAFVAHRQYMDIVDQQFIDLPPDLGGMELTEHPVMQYMRVTKGCDKPLSEAMVRDIRHIYLAMIAALDDLVGSVFRALEDFGLTDNTCVIFSSDHGEMAGEHNQILKRSMYEPSAHVPLIVAGPGCQHGARVDAPVSLIDLYPTLLDMAGLEYADFTNHPGYPETIDGESLAPLLAGIAAPRRDWAFGEYNGDRCNTGAYMLRRGKYKYVKYVGYEPQLFDLENDPWEVTNLASREPDTCRDMEAILSREFDCEAIDAEAKAYDRASFIQWREQAKANGTYEATMAHVYSGFDRQCIEDIQPWTKADEKIIQGWLSV